jgi:CheY-like chemotaxis protein
MPGAPRVLVLEDEPLVAVMMGDWLTELGCEPVGPAHTVPAALALIEGGMLDGAIRDVTIGSQDSSAAADALRVRGIPFAFATGRSGDGLTARYPDVPTLAKPYEGVLAGMLGTPARP